MSETRKLSTILFADIAGYTAMMQSDESRALRCLEGFKSEIESCVPKYDGQIVQYFGDGCLLSFDSTSQAVRCAMVMQKKFQSEDIPVRVGIHLGEVIFRENNVFGDGVNVASRIESMGIPGCVLLSKSVRDQIHNKSDFQLNSLGQFEFKNVNEPLEVYVISNPGFTVPKRAELKGKFKEKAQRSKKPWPALMIGLAIIAIAVWFISTGSSPALSDEDKLKPVAVLPFENQTMEKNLDAVGLMAMDWVSRGLMEGGGAIVIKRDGQEVASMEAKELTRGAELLVKGRYYSSGEDDLIITADVIDAKSENVLFSIDPLTGKKADPMQLLIALQQKLIGYWKLDGTYPGRPPRFDAYEAYVKAKNATWKYPYDEVVTLLQQSVALDSTFAAPLFELYHLSNWGFRTDLKEDAVKNLRSRVSGFSPYQKLRWEAYEALFSGGQLKAADLEWEIYKTYKVDHSGYIAIERYRFANHLNKTVELYESYSPIVPDTVNGVLFARYLNALYDLGRFDDVLKAIKEFPTKPLFAENAVIHLRTLARQKKFDEVDRMLAFYKDHPMKSPGVYNPSMLTLSLCAEMYMLDMHEHLPKYTEMAKEWISEIDPNYTFVSLHKTALHFINGEYKQVYIQGRKLWDEQQINYAAEFPGIALLKMGREKELEAYIEEIQNRPVSMPGTLSYALGAIEAHRNKEEAMKWLKKSEKVRGFGIFSHRHDPALKVLMDYEPFLKFTEPK